MVAPYVRQYETLPTTNDALMLLLAAVRKDVAAALTNDGAFGPLQTDANGSLRVTLSGAAAASDVNLAKVGGTAVTLGQKTMAASIPVVLPSDQSIATVAGGISGTPQDLFEAVANDVGASQQGKLFIGGSSMTLQGGVLPAIGSGLAVNILHGANIVGAVLAPKNTWDSVILDFAVGGGTQNNKPITVEIGTVGAAGALANVLASVALNTYSSGSATIASGTIDPFTGATRAATAWKLFDLTAITAKGGLGQVLQHTGGALDSTRSRLLVGVSDEDYVYVIVTAMDAAITDLLAAITPT